MYPVRDGYAQGSLLAGDRLANKLMFLNRIARRLIAILFDLLTGERRRAAHEVNAWPQQIFVLRDRRSL